MNIGIISDLHIDINKNDFSGFNNLDEYDVVLIAGDIAGSFKDEFEFLSNLKGKNIVCVAGNHLGYDSKPIEESIQKLQTLTNISYLNNSYIEVDDKIIYGGILGTDFNLYKTKTTSQWLAEKFINDFKFVKTVKGRINPGFYVNQFNTFLNGLKEVAKLNKDIIVVSHFAPSPKSIHPRWQNPSGKLLNPFYVSDLEDFIINNPCIKLWAHGHTHDSFDYVIGECRVVCNPFGYYFEQSIEPKYFKLKKVRLE